jgi:hypothetical protein
LARKLLANGPVPAESIKAAAAEAKVSERYLIAAAERLGVRSQRGQGWLPGQTSSSDSSPASPPPS